MVSKQLGLLEAESIHVLREAAASFERPVLMYSAGKDSSVLMRLAVKAFHPSRLPFPLLHIDTTWKFRELIAFRDQIARNIGVELLVHTNETGVAQGLNPFDHGPLYTDVMKTQVLKRALQMHGFDAALIGARRDEEMSRAKERVFSFRSASQQWDPENQRPEFWNLYNARIDPGESVRVFPLSDWTELDVWRYIREEDIPVAPLYFAAWRPVVKRNGVLLMVDDDRMPLRPAETPMMKMVRFRTLGCYPLTGAVESDASDIDGVIAEVRAAKTSERSGRLIDHDRVASMERKKIEGYF